MENTLQIAAIGDLHFQETTEKILGDILEDAAKQAEVLLLCGDLTDHGQEREAEGLAKILARIGIPILAVLGNHDCEAASENELKKLLKEAKVHFLDDGSYSIKGVDFCGVKGFGGGFDRFMLGSFGESTVKLFVEEALAESLTLEHFLQNSETGKKVVVLHYAPISQTLRGEPLEIYPFLGSSRLGETIDRYEVAAVFHGHAHHGSLFGITPKGTPVYNCSLPLLIKNSTQKFVTIEVKN